MTQEDIIRNCENLPDDEQHDPLYQMMLMMMNMLIEMEADRITGSEKGEIHFMRNIMATVPKKAEGIFWS